MSYILLIGVKVKLYDLKQHSETTSNLREKIIGKYIYIELSKNKINLGTYSNLILWFFKTIIKICTSFFYLRKIWLCPMRVFHHG